VQSLSYIICIIRRRASLNGLQPRLDYAQGCFRYSSPIQLTVFGAIRLPVAYLAPSP
jgi:hypothetical protein